MEIKKLTSDVCVGCSKKKPDSYQTYCDKCRSYYTSPARKCLGCSQFIDGQLTACVYCVQQQAAKIAINELFTRVADLEARLKSVDEESSAERLRQAWK